MSDKKSVDVGNVWWFWFTTSAFAVDKRLRHILRVLPRDPRCKFCNAPFQGVGGVIVRAMFGKRRSDLNPGFCNLCEQASREFPGGAEVEMSMLFADVRGSTALSEKMTATEFSQLINRFYTQSTNVIIKEDGLVEKLAGDEVAAFFGKIHQKQSQALKPTSPPHNDQNTHQSDAGADQVKAIRPPAIDDPGPQDGEYDKYPPISSVHTSERRLGLQRRNHAIGEQHGASQNTQH
jgi:hypothetical protein